MPCQLSWIFCRASFAFLSSSLFWKWSSFFSSPYINLISYSQSATAGTDLKWVRLCVLRLGYLGLFGGLLSLGSAVGSLLRNSSLRV